MTSTVPTVPSSRLWAASGYDDGLGRQLDDYPRWLGRTYRIWENPFAWGARGDGTTDDTQAFVNALATGNNLFVPKPPVEWKITAELAISTDGQVVRGEGRGSKIRQATAHKPVFDVLYGTDDVEIAHLGLTYTGVRTYSTASVRGSNIGVYTAGVWSSGDRNNFHHLYASGFTVGVVVGSWNGTDTTSATRVGNCVDHIDVDTVDWGVLIYGQDDLIVTNIRGSCVQSSGSSDPVHLVYFSPVAVGTDRCANGVVGGNWYAKDLTASHAFQIKGVTFGVLKNLIARNCGGIFSIAHTTTDTIIDGFSLDQDTGDSAATGAIYMQDATLERNTLANGKLIMGASERAIRVDGTDNELADVFVLAARTNAGATDDYDVNVNGTRNHLTNMRVDQGGAQKNRAVGLLAGSGHVVKGLKTRAAKYPLTINGATGCVASLDPNANVPNAATTALLVNTEATTKYNLDGHNRKAIAIAAGVLTPTFLDASRYDSFTLTSSDTAAFTIPSPDSAVDGMVITIDILNSSGGTLGNVSWGGTFKTTWTNVGDKPANGKRRTLTFYYNGTNWVENHKAAGDIT